jgi:hypothetical protein
MDARMQEEIKRQVALQLTQRQSTSEHGVNVSLPQLRSNCASIELPNQDDALHHFPMDDIIVPFTPCELHIPMGNTGATILVAHNIVSPVVPEKTPRSHGNPIPLAIIESRWIELSKTIGKWLFTFLEVIGRRPKDKQSIHSFYGTSAISLFPVRRLWYRCLLLNYLMIGVDESEQNSFSIINHSQLLASRV